MITVDASEALTLGEALGHAAADALDAVTPVIERAGLQMKGVQRADYQSSGNAGFRHVGSTVSYDVRRGAGHVEVEVGPAKPHGALANVAIWGTSRGGGTVRDPMESLLEEADVAVEHMQTALARAVGA